MTKIDTVIRSLEFSKVVNYNRTVQGKRRKNCEIVPVYIEQFLRKFDTVMRRLEFVRKHIEKYIDEIR